MPDDTLLSKYEAQFQIAVLQRLDRIIMLLEQLNESLPLMVVLPEGMEVDNTDRADSEWR